jgi:hypothetical protein
MKRFTPPPDYTRDSGSSEEETESDEEDEEEEEEDVNPNIVRSSDKVEDEFLKQVCVKWENNVIHLQMFTFVQSFNIIRHTQYTCCYITLPPKACNMPSTVIAPVFSCSTFFKHANSFS